MNILVTGFAYVRKNILDVYRYYPAECGDNICFLLPKEWKIKGGAFIYKPPEYPNVFTSPALCHHSNYPLIGGAFKGLMLGLPIFLFKHRRKKIDLIFSAMEPFLLSTLYEGIWAKILGIKHLIFSWENLSPETKFKGLNLLAKKIIIKTNLFFSDGIICGNKKSSKIMSRYTSKPVFQSPLSGVDEDFFTKLDIKKIFRGNNFENKIIYTFAGSLSYRKGIHHIINAFSEVSKKISNAVLVIAGTGEYEKDINELIKKSDVSSSIFRFPWISHDEMRELLSMTDIFVYPSMRYKGWEEQLGYLVMEASLMELAIITTNSGSLDEVAIDRKTAILVDPDKSEPLANAMIELGNNEDLRIRLGKEARIFMSTNFGHRVIAKRLSSFFHSFHNS
ncbi:MAG: Glycosyltransferase [Candidatus Moranbacteria bacterium GW2011_GWF2_35_39]|nr:MAG: Glycosyltransferase [Candidatus Moranbacteria bacterium GW2011_GWF2_35_39]